MASASPYKLFDVVLRHKQQLSPHLMRITLAGSAVSEMATWAPDQRVKLFFPAPDGSPARLSQDEGCTLVCARCWQTDARRCVPTPSATCEPIRLRSTSTLFCMAKPALLLAGPCERNRVSRCKSWRLIAGTRRARRVVLNGSLRSCSGGFYWLPTRLRCLRRWGFSMNWRYLRIHLRLKCFWRSTARRTCLRCLTGQVCRCSG